MTDARKDTYRALRSCLQDLGSVAVAFSGGVDSTFLLAVAHDVLGERAVAITASSVFFPSTEGEEAAAFCEEHGIAQYIVDVDVLGLGTVAHNPQDRCYQCKTALFEAMKAKAAELGIASVADGTNADDAETTRPGLRALRELGIRSPLAEVGLTKEGIRTLARALGLPSASKPSMACLATRFPYGSELEPEALRAVGQAEDHLRRLGFDQLRVRSDGKESVRIELPPEDFPKIMEESMRIEVHDHMRGLGFKHTSLDLLGFRSGSMDE